MYTWYKNARYLSSVHWKIKVRVVSHFWLSCRQEWRKSENISTRLIRCYYSLFIIYQFIVRSGLLFVIGFVTIGALGIECASLVCIEFVGHSKRMFACKLPHLTAKSQLFVEISRPHVVLRYSRQISITIFSLSQRDDLIFIPKYREKAIISLVELFNVYLILRLPIATALWRIFLQSLESNLVFNLTLSRLALQLHTVFLNLF